MLGVMLGSRLGRLGRPDHHAGVYPRCRRQPTTRWSRRPARGRP